MLHIGPLKVWFLINCQCLWDFFQSGSHFAQRMTLFFFFLGKWWVFQSTACLVQMRNLSFSGHKSKTSLSTHRSNKDRHRCDQGLLLLINSASYKMSTTSHTDRIQRRESLILHALRTSISRLNLLCHSGLGIWSPFTLTTRHWDDLVCIALKYRSNKKTLCMYIFFFSFRVQVLLFNNIIFFIPITNHTGRINLQIQSS